MSRNKREGWYAGKLYGGHWRSRYFRSPWHYTAEMAPYTEAVRNAKGAAMPATQQKGK